MHGVYFVIFLYCVGRNCSNTRRPFYLKIFLSVFLCFATLSWRLPHTHIAGDGVHRYCVCVTLIDHNKNAVKCFFNLCFEELNILSSVTMFLWQRIISIIKGVTN
jgi:hypothetical protein